MRISRHGALLGIAVSSACMTLGAVHANAAPPASKLPTLSVSDVTVDEGDEGTVDAVFTVTLSAAANKAVTVDFASVGGTATTVMDFEPVGGTLVFSRRETSKQVVVRVTGDDAEEPDEAFLLRLSDPTNAVIADGIGQGEIVNEDSPFLFIGVTGAGRGFVTSSPDGISCSNVADGPYDCAEAYTTGTIVTLTPSPAFGGPPINCFEGWEPQDEVVETPDGYQVVMDGEKVITAVFGTTSSPYGCGT